MYRAGGQCSRNRTTLREGSNNTFESQQCLLTRRKRPYVGVGTHRRGGGEEVRSNPAGGGWWARGIRGGRDALGGHLFEHAHPMPTSLQRNERSGGGCRRRRGWRGRSGGGREHTRGRRFALCSFLRTPTHLALSLPPKDLSIISSTSTATSIIFLYRAKFLS